MALAIHIYTHVDSVAEATLERYRRLLEYALPRCLEHPGTASCDLPGLAEVEISIVSDEMISQVHADYLNDPTPTDVITFPYGEILVSIDTAASEAQQHGHSTEDELLLYMIHGLLHLNGHLDAEEADRIAMHEVQDRIWAEVREL